MEYSAVYEKWLSSPALSDSERAELLAVKNDEDEKESRFYGALSFGTAGLRGTMGVGTMRMNVHTVRHATQAFSNVILSETGENAEVAVCFDCRRNSEEFAKAAAEVLAGNGIRVRIFESMRPTPELSFAIREYGCIAGINITASHNPKEYNGYKVYWADGAQLPPREAAEVAAEMEKTDIFEDIKRIPFEKAGEFITVMGKETDERFLENVMAQATGRVTGSAAEMKIVYTPFHGAGRELVPEALKRLGFKNIYCVSEQMEPDGNFPTVASPNPENPEGFYLAVELADKVGADFIVGTDPDSDRVGVLVRAKDGHFEHLSGNKTGVLLLDHIIKTRRAAGRLPENPVALKTIVTTNMARSVAEKNGLRCFDTFTGFKFMAEKKNALESAGEGHVIFSYEESYGYMIGDFLRDKDAVTASLLLCEMAANYAERGMTLLDALDALYGEHGFFAEKTVNLVMPGIDGLEDRVKLMASLRANPPKEIAGFAVENARDYLTGVSVSAEGTEKMELSGSDVLGYTLSDGTDVYVRPSGTEPKIKVYALARGKTLSDAERVTAACEAWAETLR